MLFPKAGMVKGCPCKILKLEKVKSKVEKVVEQWGKEDEGREVREFFET